MQQNDNFNSRIFVLLLLATIGRCAPLASAQPIGSNLISIGNSQFGNTALLDVNNNGEAVGNYGGGQAMFYSAATGPVKIPGLGISSSRATAINDLGEAVAWATISGTIHTFTYTIAGGTTDLSYNGTPYAVNDSGVIVGTYSPGAHAFIYTPGIGAVDAGLGGTTSDIQDITDAGAYVGRTSVIGGYIRANGVTTQLGSISGGYALQTNATALNDLNQVVGQSLISGGQYGHAFVYQNGIMADLGTLGGNNSAANDINHSGTVVGWSIIPGGVEHAFVELGGTMWDLNTLFASQLTGPGPHFTVLQEATAINDSGVIVGNAQYDDGTTVSSRAFMLTVAAPEPTGGQLLILSAFAALSAARPRRDRK